MKSVSCPENIGHKGKPAWFKVRVHPADFISETRKSESTPPFNFSPVMRSVYNLPSLRRLRGETATPLPYDRVPRQLWPILESMDVPLNGTDVSQFRLHKV